MSYNFYIDSSNNNGNSLNSGSTSNIVNIISNNGNWDASTYRFTATSGTPFSSGVNIGDWASINPSSYPITRFVSKINNIVSGIYLDLDSNNRIGTTPLTSSGNINCRIGGCWDGSTLFISGSGGLFSQNQITASDDIVINIKNNIYTYNQLIEIRSSHLSYYRLKFKGYQNIIEDLDYSNNFSQFPTFLSTNNTILLSGNYQDYYNINFQTNATSSTANIIGQHQLLYKCSLEAQLQNTYQTFGSPDITCWMVQCYLKGYSDNNNVGIIQGGNLFQCVIDGGLLNGSSANGIVLSNNKSNIILNNIIRNCYNGILNSNTVNYYIITNNTIYNCLQNGYCSNSNANTNSIHIHFNNLFVNISGFGISGNSINPFELFTFNNAFYNCVSGNYVPWMLENFSLNTIQETEMPLVNPGSGLNCDFSLKPTARSIGAGAPGIFPFNSAIPIQAVSYVDIGAVQNPIGLPNITNMLGGL